MFPSPQVPTTAGMSLVNNTFAPEIFCAGVSGMSLMNGVVTVTLETLHCDHARTPPILERVVAARLTLPIPATQALLLGLHQFLGSHGLNPLPAASETRQ